jgi:8-amino-7-oxononanoate synthase
LPPAATEAIFVSYKIFPQLKKEREKIKELIHVFQNASIKYRILKSDTPIQIVIIPGNEEVKKVAATLQQNNFDIRPILYPTIPKGQERLRIVLHSFNTVDEVQKMVKFLE